jgi:hypothetical protein
MKANLLTTIALLTVFAVPALADAPNRVTQSFEEFVGASGCVIRDNAAGQSNLYSLDGGSCPASVLAAWNPVRGKVQTAGADGISGTADDVVTPGDN